ncbi:translation initiation factor 4B, partial [Tremellales sp. Uapishka_1]
MALSDFFADTTTGSWADEMEALPSAPAPKDPSALRRGDPGYFESLPDRGSRGPSFPGNAPSREELPIPTVPPFTVYVGNLTFETDEEELSSFFTDLTPISVKTIKDPTGKSKGFGYVEFDSQDKLKEGLARTGGQLGGRTIRISVAEPPSTQRRDGFGGPSMAEESNQWRRSGPLPTREAQPIPTRRVSNFGDTSPQPERDWSAARGTKFTPAAPSASSDFRRESSGPGMPRERDIGGPTGQADGADAWRSSKPLAEPKQVQREMPPHQAPRSPGMADTESTWTRGSKLRTPVVESAPARSTTNSPAAPDDREWRSSKPGSGPTSEAGEASPAPAPSVRQKLQLAPRSSPNTPSLTQAEPSPSSKASPFGAARAVDTASRENEAAAKLAAREEERKKAKEVENQKIKEEAEKARQFSEERTRQINQAREKAKGQIQPHPSRRVSNQDKVKSPQVESDGFVVAGKSAKTGAQTKDDVKKEKKDTSVRSNFSFAAAAGKIGLLDDNEEDESVKEVENGVKEVSV